MRDYTELNKMVETGKAKIVKQLVEAAIAEGADPKEILEQGLLPGMSVIGEKFKNNEVYVPEVLVAARAMNAGTTLLKPLLVSADVQAPGTAVIGTVRGDLHDIGKNLVPEQAVLVFDMKDTINAAIKEVLPHSAVTITNSFFTISPCPSKRKFRKIMKLLAASEVIKQAILPDELFVFQQEYDMKKTIVPENPKITPEMDFRYYMNFIETNFGRKDSVDTDNNYSGGEQKPEDTTTEPLDYIILRGFISLSA